MDAQSLSQPKQTYRKAPLPFVGQKRNFLKHLISVLQQNIPNDGAGWTIVDVFGGSGLLAHTAKRTLPKARVIYNDFDGYAERIKNIPDTNRLRDRLAEVLDKQPRDKALNADAKAAVVVIIRGFGGYKDLNCLRSWLLYSGKEAATPDCLYGETLYNRLRLSPYPEAADYLDGLDITSQSFETLLPRYAGQDNTLLILDPPYVCTQQGMYANQTYFGMVPFLTLAQMVRPPFVFFSSTRSEFLDYLGFLRQYKPQEWANWAGFGQVTIRGTLSKGSCYEDNMVYRFER
nr:MAG TPA: DNA adenine methylase [Caudoviricetes sp.]